MIDLAIGTTLRTAGRSRRRRWVLFAAAFLMGAMAALAAPAAAPAMAATPVVATLETPAATLSTGVERPGLVRPMASTRVCAPNGKCVTTSNYCTIASGCSKALYKAWPVGQYCSPSVGCFTYGGKKYSYIGGPVATAEQQVKAAQCAVGLGFAAVTAGAGGPAGVTVAGVALTVWGCL